MRIKLIIPILILLISLTSTQAAILSGLDNSVIPIASNGCSVFGCTMIGDIDMNGFNIYNATFTNVTFNYTIIINSSQISNPIWVETAGDTMTGTLNMSGNDIVDVGTLNANLLQGSLSATYITSAPWLDADDQRYNDTYILTYVKRGDNIFLYNDTDTIYLNQTALGEFVNNSINSSFPPYVAFTNQNNTFTVDQVLNDSVKLTFRNSLNDTFFFYNTTNNTLQLFVNGIIQQSWGASTYIFGKATFFDNADFQNITGQGVVLDTNLFVTQNTTSTLFIGNGSRITEVCLSNGSNCEGVITNINFSINQTLQDYLLADDQRYNDTVLILDVNQSLWNLIMNNTAKQGDQIYLYNDTTTIYLNETKLNQTINNISQISFYDYNITLESSGGIVSNISDISIDFQITHIIVTPSNPLTKYRFSLEEYPSGSVIDKDLALHTGVWGITKNYALDSVVRANITNVITSDDNFTVTIRYLNNGA